MSERDHLSIGEVLSLLRDEFPDITISKIRFLESQGLVDPERTPSGYRKFYDEDVERLRWILRQQREHFLPLKVIKGRLSEGDQEPGGPSEGGADEVVAGAWPLDTAGPAASAGAAALSPEPTRRPGTSGESVVDPAAASAGPAEVAWATDPARPGPSTRRLERTGGPDLLSAGSNGPAAEGAEPEVAVGPRSGPADSAVDAGASQESAGLPASRRPATSRPPTSPAPGPGRPDIEGPSRRHPSAATLFGDPEHAPRSAAGLGRPPLADTSVEANLTAEELAAACGLPVDGVKELERYGLVASRDVGGTAYYGEEAQAVARLAAGFAGHGVEARHLRMYKNGAERESALFEQIVMPLIKQRNPQARHQAADTLEELARLGSELHAVLLRRSLRDAL